MDPAPPPPPGFEVFLKPIKIASFDIGDVLLLYKGQWHETIAFSEEKGLPIALKLGSEIFHANS